jgi:hypothetical protein
VFEFVEKPADLIRVDRSDHDPGLTAEFIEIRQATLKSIVILLLSPL